MDDLFTVARCAFCRDCGAALKICNTCKHVKYCSIACQRQHWPSHKTECKQRAASLHDESPPATAGGRPLIFALSPPGRVDETMHFYSPNADVMAGDYAALLHFASAYGYSLGIYQCPDLAAFRAANPTANVRPFSEVPANFIAMGHEVIFS